VTSDGFALPAEFGLAAACCRWPPSADRDAAIRAAGERVRDWERFLCVVRRHRVEGLVHAGLASAGLPVPDQVMDALRECARGIAGANLRHAVEAVRLQRQFDHANLPVLFLKGASLGALAYGGQGIKRAIDIDVLIDGPDAVDAACAQLAQAGYRRLTPPATFSDRQFRTWVDWTRESMFRNDARRITLDLHWRPCENQAVLPRISTASSCQTVEVFQGGVIRTLNSDDLFSFLCVHGARHGWSRLKWLADLMALVAAKPDADIERLYRLSQTSGAGRCPAQALLLCNRLFDVALPAALVTELRSDRTTRWLEAIALDALADAAGREIDDRPLGNLTIQISHFLLGRGASHWSHELRFKAVGETDCVNWSLPGPLRFLYPVLRIPSWLWRRLRSVIRGRRRDRDPHDRPAM
jgi:hypothetical protein